jgi:DNA-binding transcriptional LysR family regulator
MVPTAFARNLIGPVREALLTLERGLFSSVPFSPAETSRRFTIGMPDVLETVWLPRLSVALQSEAPHMTCVTTRVMRRELEQELATGALDLAIDVSVPVSAAVRRAPLGADRVVVVARRKHPGLRAGLDLETYLRLSHVLVSARRKGPGLEDFALERIGRSRRVALRCQNHLAACHVVRDTDLLLTMPEQHAKLANIGTDNRLYPFPLEVPSLEVHMYWHASSDNDAASSWLRERITQVAQNG